jgi:hypothetical protein
MREAAWPVRLTLAAGLALGLLALGCSGGDGNKDGGNDQDAGQDGQAGDEDDPQRVLVFGNLQTVDDEQAGLQLDLAAGPDGEFAIAYYKLGEQTQPCNSEADCTEEPPQSAEWSCITGECVAVCTEPILGDDEVPVRFDHVRYAWSAGDSWQHEDITTISSVVLSGISIAFDGATPLVAFLGGAGGSQVCGGTDVMVARRNGPGNWSSEAAVATSGEAAAGADCPKMQGICDFGDVVGLWPSLAVAPDGTIGIAYRDIHNGYTKEAQDSSDLEWTWSPPGGGSWGHEWIDLARGSGLFNSLAFDADGEPAVAFYNGKDGVISFDHRVDGAFTGTLECASAADCPEGLECIQSTGWCWNVIARPERAMKNEPLSLVIAPDGRFLLAYFDPDSKNLMIAHSTDGLSWQTGIIDSDGSTGLFPSMVIEPISGMPMVAYYRCSDYDPDELDCNHNEDGPRLAVFEGTWPDELGQQNKWTKNQDLIDAADPDATDGRNIRLAVTADGQVGIAYAYSWIDPIDGSSHQSLMFRRGTWQEQ